MSTKTDFSAWMAKVDAAVNRICGLSVYDLADYAFRDAYDAGESASQVARTLLEEEGWNE